ncbi:MAG TPA: porin [Planctomycetota bacterium]|nr:porin [Planctomycetota bacterium]
MIGIHKIGVMAAMVLFYPGITVFAQQDAAKPAPAESKEGQTKPPAPTPTPVDPSQKEPGTEPVIKVSLKDGVHFKSDDGNFDIILGGYLGIHYRVFAHRPNDNVKTSPDTWYVRQARPELSGFIYKDFDFRVQLDFPTGAAAINGTIQDAYAGWRRIPEFSLRVGQFKEPFGQEQTSPDRYLDFDERSEGDKFTPQRDLGIGAYGTIAKGFFTYELGYFNGQGRAVLDTNKGKEEAGRLRLQPFAASDDSFIFKYLRFGVAGTVAAVQKAPVAAFTSNTAYLNVNYLTTAAVATNLLDGERTRWGGEFTWNYGPVGLRAESWRRTDTVDTATTSKEKLRTTAWSAQASWLLTGEKKPIEGRVLPGSPFNPDAGTWGAFEVAARVDRVHIDDDIFSLGIAAQAGNANVVTGYSFGFNWYLTRNIRISPNVYWEVTDDPITFAGNHTDAHFFGGILRFQLEF